MQKHTNEIWKDIEGYNGYYQVSNHGNVKSLKGNVERILKISKHSGYPIVTLSKNCICKTFLVHRLVAEAFIPNPDNLPIINHKDNSRDNNVASNLEWCTQKYNVNYSKHKMKHPHNVSTSSGRKYINILPNGRYKVRVFHKHERRFKDLESAIAFRNQFIAEELWES